MIILEPDGRIGGFPTSEELWQCPWFWNKKKGWIYRPEWLKLRGTELAKAAEKENGS